MAENEGFDITAFFGSVSDLDTGRQQIVYLPFEKIKPDPANFYSTDGVEDLAGSIEMIGLQQPLYVRPGAEGEYVIISGHRRHMAIGRIIEGGSQQFAEGVPCIIDNSNDSPAVLRFKLLMANKDTRKMTSADENRQAAELEDVLRQLVDEGYHVPGRLRDWVSKLSGFSRTKLARMKLIRDKLAPEIRDKYYNAGKLNENTAYTLAQMPEDLQVKLFKASQNATAAGYERIAKIVQAGNDYSCTDLTGPGCKKCTHGTAFLRHDLEDPLDPCKGKTCCLKCEKAERSYWACDRMCSKAKDRRAKRNAAEKERQESERKRKGEKLRREIQASAIRLVKAADAAGVGDDVKLPMSNGYFSSRTVAWVRAAAAGGEIGMVYENDLDPKRLHVTAAAKALHCSADYICGLTDELQPTAEISEPEGAAPPPEVKMPAAAPAEKDGPFIDFRWRTGEPGKKDEGWAVVKARIDDDLTIRRTLYWNGRYWNINDRPGSSSIASEIKVVGWFPLPPDEEEQA